MLRKGLLVFMVLLLILPVLLLAGCADDDEEEVEVVYELTDERLTLQLDYPTGNVVRMNNAEVLQEMLGDIGIEIELAIHEFSVLVPKVYDDQDFDLYLMGWSLALDPDPAGIWLSTDKWNSVNFDHPDNDRLIMEAKRTLDQSERRAIYSEWQDLLVEEAPYVWFYAEEEAWVANPRIKNFAADSFGVYWYVWEWEATDGPNQAIVALWSAPEGLLTPNLNESVYDAYSFEPVFDGLMRWDPRSNYDLVPNIAKSMDISDDNLIITFELREDVYFHDGVNLTAEDVKFTFEWICHPDYQGVRYSIFQDLVGAPEYNAGEADEVTGIEIIDDYTIRFHLSAVDAPFLGRMAPWGIHPKHYYGQAAIGDLGAGDSRVVNPIGAGPFKFVRYVDGQFTELAAYDEYHLGAPKLETIIVKVASSDVAQAEAITGESDIVWVQPNIRDYELYEAEGLKIHRMPANAYQYMGIQTKHPILSDKRVRHAITHAIDKELIVETLMDGLGVLQVCHISSVSWGYDPTIKPLPYDPERAGQLLDEAGWRMGDDGYRYRVAEPTEE